MVAKSARWVDVGGRVAKVVSAKLRFGAGPQDWLLRGDALRERGGRAGASWMTTGSTAAAP